MSQVTKRKGRPLLIAAAGIAFVSFAAGCRTDKPAEGPGQPPAQDPPIEPVGNLRVPRDDEPQPQPPGSAEPPTDAPPPPTDEPPIQPVGNLRPPE